MQSILALAAMVDRARSNDRVLAAECFRACGRFAECIQLLDGFEPPEAFSPNHRADPRVRYGGRSAGGTPGAGVIGSLKRPTPHERCARLGSTAEGIRVAVG